MMKSVLILFFLTCAATNLHASCKSVEEKRIAAQYWDVLRSPFWQSDTQLRLGQRWITFSHDTEITDGEAIKIAQRDPKAWRNLNKQSPKFPIPLTALQSLFGMTENQVKAFVIRKGAEPATGAPAWNLLDLNPAFVDRVTQRNPIFYKLFKEALMQATFDSLRARNLDVNVHLDHNASGQAENVEVTNYTYSRTPLEYARHMQQLDREVDHFIPHVHLGIPAVNNVTSEQRTTFARRVEAKLALDLLTTYGGEIAVDGTEYFTDTTTFGYFIKYRGWVRYTESRWTNPKSKLETDDLEIRMGLNYLHQMQVLEFAAKEISQMPRLAVSAQHYEFEGENTSELMGLAGYAKRMEFALRFCADMLRGSSDNNAQKFLALVEQANKKIADAGENTNKLTKALNESGELLSGRVDEILDIRHFVRGP